MTRILNLRTDPAFTTPSLDFLAASPTGKAGVLTAGESVTIAITGVATTTPIPSISRSVKPILASRLTGKTSIPTSRRFLQRGGRPGILQNETGPNWDGFVALIDRSANLVPPQLSSTTNFKALFNLALQEALAAVNPSISGTLQSDDPAVIVAGRTVFATDTITGDVYSTTAFNNGSYIFGTLPNDTFTFDVNGLALNAPPTIDLSGGESLTGVQLNANIGTVITGQVLAEATGVPIAGADIDATDDATGVGYRATTDANGYYSLSGLPAGDFDLVVNAPGYAQAEIVGVDASGGDAVQDVGMAAQSSLLGTVTLASGGPGGAELVIVATLVGGSDADQIYSTSSTTTSFQLDGLPAGTYDITVSMPGYIAQTLSAVVVPSGESVDLGELTLQPASEIDGVVTSSDPNNPPAHIVVEAWQNGTVAGPTPSRTTSVISRSLTLSQAHTNSRAVRSGRFRADGHGGFRRNDPGRRHRSSTRRDDTGTLTGQGGEPLGGVPVNLAGPNGLFQGTTTSSDGTYEFTGLAAGSGYQVYLPIGGANTSQVVSITEVDGTAVTADLQLAYAATITGTLTDKLNNPITDGTVTLYLAGEAITDAVTNSAGVYTFFVIEPGTFDLAAFAAEGTFATAASISVTVGSTITQDFQTGTGTLVVAVSDGVTPVEGEYALLEADFAGHTNIVEQVAIAADGTATFSNLVAGDYTVVVVAANGHFGQTTANVVADATANANIALSTLATASGTITDGSANPLADAVVVFQPTGNLQQSFLAFTAADGKYSLALEPGTYDVTVFADGYAAHTQAGVVVSVSETVNDTLALSTTTVNATLVDGLGYPVPGGDVTVRAADGHVIGIASARPDGSFTVNTASGDNLTLELDVPSYASVGPIVFDAPAGTTTTLDPIVLQPVAIDPGDNQNPGQPPLVPDGQAYADKVLEQAMTLKSKVSKPDPLLPKPACPLCDGFYDTYKAAHENLKTTFRTFQDEFKTVRALAESLIDRVWENLFNIDSLADFVSKPTPFGSLRVGRPT